MKLETDRLIVKEFTLDMASDVSKNSLDADTKKYLPDEVFETTTKAKEILLFLINNYKNNECPLVYPIFLKKENINIGYVQIIKLENNTYEIGYHIAKRYTCNGYATEALKMFLPEICNELKIKEIYATSLKENVASVRVLEKCGFIKTYEGLGKYQGKDKEIIKEIYQNNN